MSKIKTACALLLILTLSACGGGGGGGGAVVRLAVPEVLSNAPGASFNDDGDPIEGTPVTSTLTVRDIEAAFDALETAIGLDSSMDGSLTAVTPAGKATLNGYVRIRSTTGSIERKAFGHLTITADFDAAPGTPDTVTATATDFREFNIANPDAPRVATIGTSGGTLSGTGMIDGTTITSTLDGGLTDVSGSLVTVDSMLSGDVYDSDGTLVTYGTVEGEFQFSSGNREAFTDGEFAASGDIEPPSE